MITLRLLTEIGIHRFRESIHDLKEGKIRSLPKLDSPDDSVPFHKLVQIDENKTFNTRLEIAEYLYEVFGKNGLKRSDVIPHHGMWTWLAYIWFDSICEKVNGVIKVKDTSRYICSSHWEDYYRHSIAAVYNIYSIHGKNNSRLFLHCLPYILNDFVEDLASRQWIISNTRLIDVAHRLYWDDKNNKPKKGSVTRNKPGTLRRFIKVMGQFELTYDIHTIEPEIIIGFLPNEFKVWFDGI